MEYTELDSIELIKYHEDVYAVRVNGDKILNTRDPLLNAVIDIGDINEIVQNGCMPQAMATELYGAAVAKKTRHNIIEKSDPKVITALKDEPAV